MPQGIPKYFSELGALVTERWAKRGFDPQVFPAIAAKALRDRPPVRAVRHQALLQYVLRTPALEFPFPAPFGEPPVTLFRGEHFYIEALFWMSSTTAIHAHAFRGAFSVLSGASLHSVHDWKASHVVNPGFQLGALARRTVEVLRPGQVREIRGDELIHSLFHLEYPSVTIVVRTFTEPRPQAIYLPPSVALDPQTKVHLRDSQISALSVLWRSRDRLALPETERFVARADAEHVFYGLRALQSSGLPLAEKAALFQLFKRRSPKWAGAFLEVFEHERRRNELIGRRATTRNPDHLLLLALVLNLDRRSEIAAAVRRVAQGQPFTHVRRWLSSMRAERVAGPLGPNGLGFECTDAQWALVDAWVRDGRRPAGAEGLAALAQAPLFAPLLRVD